MKTNLPIENTKWIRKSPYSVKETTDRLISILSETPQVRIIARVNQQEIASLSGKDINEVECLLFQNSALVGKLLTANIEAGFALPIKALIWKDTHDDVWMRCTDIDRLDKFYNLQGADGAIKAIHSLLPSWLDRVVGALPEAKK